VAVFAASAAKADPQAERLPSSIFASPERNVTGSINAPTANAPTGPLEQQLLPSPATGQRGVQMRTNFLDSHKLQAGPTFDYRPDTTHPAEPLVASRRNENKPVELGGFVGYLFHDEVTGQPAGTVGMDLQFATDPKGSSGGWLVQPGLDYSTALSPSWQFNTRLFSTYAPDSSNVSGLGLDRSAALRSGGSGEPGFQDVGVGLGLGYSITDNWNIQTQARYQRMLGAGEADSPNDASPHQFFGGVMVDYKF
jgi:hypothetical protein